MDKKTNDRVELIKRIAKLDNASKEKVCTYIAARLSCDQKEETVTILPNRPYVLVSDNQTQ